MIRPININLNAAHPELPLVEATTFTGAPSSVFIRGVPKAVGNWSITAVSVAVTYPDNTTTARAAVESAEGVWVATIPGTATSGRTAAGFKIMADGIDENGAAVTGYVLGFADFAVLSFFPVPSPGETFFYLRYFDTMPTTAKKMDVTTIDGILKYYNGTAWLPFADLSNYYTKAETDNAIERVAAYYITYNAAGAAFPTRADLLNAQTYYSGGVARVPTRNDYAVVLADEAHSGAEWRYIYAVADGQTTGQWEAQYPVEGVIAYDNTVTPNSGNGVKSSGIWSALWGALASLPTGFSSLYDWCVAQLRAKIDSTSAASIFTAKTYAVNDLCTYNSAVYRCKNAYTATASSAKPDADTTHWEAKPISDLFLPLAGGEIIGDLTVNGRVNVSAFFSIYRILSQGLLFSGSINNVWRSALLPLSTASDSSISVIAFLQNIAPDYKETSTYELNSLCVYKGMLYRCTTAITNAEEWTAAHWTLATVEDVLAALRTGKADKPTTFTAGNLAALDANGNPVDSDIPAANVALKSAIPYDLGTPIVIDTASSEVVEGETVNYGAATLAYRTANIVQVTAATALDELRITFPAATSGKVRDFGLRVEIGTGSAALTAPALVPIAPTGETIKIENNAAEIPALADGTATAKGVTLLYFSENAPGVFVVKGEQVEEVA